MDVQHIENKTSNAIVGITQTILTVSRYQWHHADYNQRKYQTVYVTVDHLVQVHPALKRKADATSR